MGLAQPLMKLNKCTDVITSLLFDTLLFQPAALFAHIGRISVRFTPNIVTQGKAQELVGSCRRTE